MGLGGLGSQSGRGLGDQRGGRIFSEDQDFMLRVNGPVHLPGPGTLSFRRMCQRRICALDHGILGIVSCGGDGSGEA